MKKVETEPETEPEEKPDKKSDADLNKAPTGEQAKNVYAWCTYREWSFKILEAVQALDSWQLGLIITTDDCLYDLGYFEEHDIPIVRVSPAHARAVFEKGGVVYDALTRYKPQTLISPGWSWYIPHEVLDITRCVTYHPGKLPQDRGGSPIQNQMRQGKLWSYLNVMQQEEGLDEGGIYVKEKISLEGTADDVWRRMTSAGTVLTQRYLEGLAEGWLEPTPQADEDSSCFYRVKREQARLDPERQTATQMHNIVRAHHESDPNSYVIPAFIVLPPLKGVSQRFKLEVYHASLINEFNLPILTLVDANMKSAIVLSSDTDAHTAERIRSHSDYNLAIHMTNNQEQLLHIIDWNGNALYIAQAVLRIASDADINNRVRGIVREC